ncbi:MAG: hypothetical protein WBC21_01115 [Minisyncoccales bacterium]
MTNETEIKPKKPIWKKWWFWLIVIFVIIIIAPSGEEKKKAQEQPQISEQKFSFENYIKENKVRDYEIANEEDISVKALGVRKLSDYSIQELEDLPLNFRMKYQIVVSSDITLEELKSTLAQVVKEKSTENPDIDEIVVQSWESEENLKGGNPTIGYTEWCPNGNWDGITQEIAKDNIRDSYKIIYHIDEKTLESIKEVKEETLFGLTEAIRKEIFTEIAKCEDWADLEAMKRYFPGCEYCSEFITADIYKYADNVSELTDSCKEKLRKEYSITKEESLKITIEGVEKRWPSPKRDFMPGCCN